MRDSYIRVQPRQQYVASILATLANNEFESCVPIELSLIRI